MEKDPNDAPKAYTTRWYKCDACENLHVLLLDEDDEPISTAVISREMILNMLDELNNPAATEDTMH